MAKVAIKFRCAKQSKNLERYLSNRQEGYGSYTVEPSAAHFLGPVKTRVAQNRASQVT